MNIQQYLHEVLDYDPLTGITKWLRRPRSDFQQYADYIRWNNRYSNTEAGYLDPTTSRLRATILGKTWYLDKLIWYREHGDDPAIYHKNGWNADNILTNLTPEKCRRATRYGGQQIILTHDELTYIIISPINDPRKFHMFGRYENVITARTQLLELADKLQSGWKDLTK